MAMRRTVATLTLAVALLLLAGSIEVSGQVPCGFVGGFAALRELVGAGKVGDCFEDERVNPENGNAEQRTSGGLLVRRAGESVSAFTDGVTTWVDGPNGLQSRPNDDRFAWELEAMAAAAALAATEPTATSTPPADALTPPPGPSSVGLAAPSVENGLPPPPPPAAASPAALGAPASVATPTKAATKTPTPTPAVTVKLREKPDRVDTGSDARFEVETNAEEGRCSLAVTYRNKDELQVASGEIDDGRCELEYTLPKDARTGKATAKITVVATEGMATIDDEFDVRKGDIVLSGDIDIKLEGDDLPDEVEVGDEIKIAVETSLKDKGKCEMTVAWPRYTSYTGEAQTPDDDGRCSWKVTVPVEIPKKGTANLSVVVRKNNKKASAEYRVLTKEIEVRK
jgi:hypothetical protein